MSSAADTAPASPGEPPMEEEFRKLASRIQTSGAAFALANSKAGEDRAFKRYHDAVRALHRWHREQVERAVREAVEYDRSVRAHFTAPPTLADPAAEALMADGERYRAGAVRVRQREPFGDVPDGVEWESPTPEAP